MAFLHAAISWRRTAASTSARGRSSSRREANKLAALSIDHELVAELSRILGCNVLVGVRVGDAIVFIDYVGEESPSLTFVARTHARRPLYTSAAGKTLLANLPDDEMYRLLDMASPEQQGEVRHFLAELPDIRATRLAFASLGHVRRRVRRRHAPAGTLRQAHRRDPAQPSTRHKQIVSLTSATSSRPPLQNSPPATGSIRCPEPSHRGGAGVSRRRCGRSACHTLSLARAHAEGPRSRATATLFVPPGGSTRSTAPAGTDAAGGTAGVRGGHLRLVANVS